VSLGILYQGKDRRQLWIFLTKVCQFPDLCKNKRLFVGWSVVSLETCSKGSHYYISPFEVASGISLYIAWLIVVSNQ
jgi:hypothetical protein